MYDLSLARMINSADLATTAARYLSEPFQRGINLNIQYPVIISNDEINHPPPPPQ